MSGRMTGYLGLGSNVGDRRARLQAAADALPGHGVAVEFIGCPTLLDHGNVTAWREDHAGPVLLSSSPVLRPECTAGVAKERIRLVSHDARSAGDPLQAFEIFEGASLVITGRLHAALPAVARGIRVRFYGEPYWHQDYRGYPWGSVRYTLLAYLGISADGRDDVAYPSAAVRALKDTHRAWVRKALGE